MSAMYAVTKTNERVVLFEKKPFAKIPHVKHWLSKCNQIDSENYCQNVKLSNFEAYVDSFLCKKNEFLDAAKSSIKDLLSEAIKTNKVFESIVLKMGPRKNWPHW